MGEWETSVTTTLYSAFDFDARCFNGNFAACSGDPPSCWCTCKQALCGCVTRMFLGMLLVSRALLQSK